MAKKPLPQGTNGPFSTPFAALAELRKTLGESDANTPPEPAESLPAAPANPFSGRVVVSQERSGRGGKTVTRIQGLAADETARAELSRDLRKELGVSSHFEGDDLILSGDQRQRAREWLERRGASRVTMGN